MGRSKRLKSKLSIFAPLFSETTQQSGRFKFNGIPSRLQSLADYLSASGQLIDGSFVSFDSEALNASESLFQFPSPLSHAPTNYLQVPNRNFRSLFRNWNRSSCRRRGRLHVSENEGTLSRQHARESGKQEKNGV